MKQQTDSTVEPFNHDVVRNRGYLYTTDARLSSQIANRRLSDATVAAADFCGKRIIDIGCGDGTYTIELFDRGKPSSICGVDPAQKAIDIARQKAGGRNIAFEVQSAYELPYAANSFHVAHLRGVLHHLERPADALREALRVAPVLIVIEPNGYNPGVKLLERFSRYHRDHEEKSYPPMCVDRWIGAQGGTVEYRKWVGLVPFFCPDWFARAMKLIEPMIERLPLVNAMMCAVYVVTAIRNPWAQSDS